jgi:hypothetical protein
MQELFEKLKKNRQCNHSDNKSLYYNRRGDEYIASIALDDPDFIGYEYANLNYYIGKDDGGVSARPRVVLSNPEGVIAHTPADTPVFVLFKN